MGIALVDTAVGIALVDTAIGIALVDTAVGIALVVNQACCVRVKTLLLLGHLTVVPPPLHVRNDTLESWNLPPNYFQ